ncbi:uncharacterized protein LOC130719065 [Lotus japonicus]|uniref:uncharacterized protein LOC130719065 n=1 Tax=Lotus japonicus TaxID=34305 RepID=UPI00258B4857|nr:uncharacterized protein LOC130719065 [Lotus japonicus]
MSYNVRGLGSRLKRRVIRELVLQQQVELICIQETKLETVDASLCSQIWGDTEFEWKMVPSINRGGGILCIWKQGIFNLQEFVIGNGFLGLVGVWGDMTVSSVIVNVYSSCHIEEKRRMWEELLDWKRRSSSTIWCVGGDFNSVREEDERRGVAMGVSSQRREMFEFNNFIESMEMLDLPLAGRKFTWCRPNGRAQSRIDRFLVSPDWIALWPNCSVLGLNRDISDHCPLLLRSKITDWGPKPFRVMNCWFQDTRFVSFVKQAWGEN